MQAKGLIKFFVILLTLVCLYQLSFTFFAVNIEKKAESAATERVLSQDTTGMGADSVKTLIKENRIAYLDSIYNEPVLNLGIKEFTYSDVKSQQLSLGLDLQGGMSVVLQVSLKEMLLAMSNNSQDPAFRAALEEADKAQVDSDEDYIALFAQAYAAQPNKKPLFTIFATQENAGKIDYNDTDEEILEVIAREADGAVRRTYEVISNRIDEFGVSQPTVTLQEGNNRILIELPGIDNPKRARDLLQSTAKLEFWETWKNSVEMYNYLDAANNIVREKLGLMDTTETDTTEEGNILDEVLGEADGAEETGDETAETDEIDSETVTDTDTSENEDDLFSDILSEDGETTDSIAQETLSDEERKRLYPLFDVLSPAVNQGQMVEGPIIGYAFAQDRNKAMEYLSFEEVKAVFPKNIKFAWGAKPIENNLYALYALKTRPNEDAAPLEGDAIVDANQDFGQAGDPLVNMTMNSEGAFIWKKLTAANVGNYVAVVLDNKVYSAPVVRQEIGGGVSQISGNFTISEAKDLSSIIRAGKLPAPARIVQEEFVGPSLGKESIRAGSISLAVGLIIVLVFMILYYNKSGIIADLSLVLNLLFIIGTLASRGASLTLPGIAGVVLTIGMAVDANVIIFERIREELRKGKGMRLAISEGYQKSYAAIIDANVTTLITAIILLTFGIGPVKGFAVILFIGILSSFVTAVLVSRLMVEGMTNDDKSMSFSTKLTENILQNPAVKFLDKRKISYTISTILIVVGIASIGLRGFNLGVDFTGGRTYVVQFEQPVSTVDVAAALSDQFDTEPIVKTYGNASQLQITTKYLIDQNDPATDSIVDAHLYDGLKQFYDPVPEFDNFIENYKQSGTKVGPTIADDIYKTSIYAAIFAFLAIFVYLLIRFRKWQFGLGALVAVVHDSLILLSVFSLLSGILPFSLEIDQAFIAALLTIIGYSINDTVIVFDRVREYMLEYPSKSIKQVADMAVNSTLSRTLMTSLTTLIVVLVLFLFGGEVIRGFAFALLIGILVGTYSSIFVATPLVVDLMKDDKKK